MTLDKKYTLVLGSQSPRRKELLGWLNIPFEICAIDIEEITEKTTPKDVAEDLALIKGRAVWEKLKEKSQNERSYNPFVISSDTIVTLGEKIYGKPKNSQDAKEMLKELAGKTHLVITSVCMCFLDKSNQLVEDVFSCETEVTFRTIDDDILDDYIETGESLDKAGSYGIQGQGLVFISELKGSYSNVVGFPLDVFHHRLKKNLGFEGDSTGSWRQSFIANIT